MTKENALNAYKHFRDLEKNYEPREGLNSGPTSMTRVRARAKASADNILIRNPEFAKPIVVKNLNNEVMKEPVTEKKKDAKK